MEGLETGLGTGTQIQGRLTVQSSLIAHVCVEYKQRRSNVNSHLTPGRFVYAAGMEDHNPLLESRLHFYKKCLSPCQQSARGVMPPRCHCLRRGALRLSRSTWTRVNSMDSRCAERSSRAKVELRGCSGIPLAGFAALREAIGAGAGPKCPRVRLSPCPFTVSVPRCVPVSAHTKHTHKVPVPEVSTEVSCPRGVSRCPWIALHGSFRG